MTDQNDMTHALAPQSVVSRIVQILFFRNQRTKFITIQVDFPKVIKLVIAQQLDVSPHR